ncbi:MULTISPECIES: GDSL-type esterase/lipase family protein [unclassified Paenibacillus]|uniref:GDSL-type esterase/lipase family protein n=1 Tax=unclassified Paenibacillus TaxID=185978 RepID=UPI001C0FF6FC|nr:MULTISPECIES: GDSL-type esterase/lipase family protein [unclassified Paenibacillus]MBU5443632.1 lysophospholipase [Paenibacillus sp. MSJ-34]CAH0122717.1 hypothetical protein PAE9249_05306 [Paenibacillus sp. CECT 9249]
MRKNFIAFLLIGIIALSLAACGNQGKGPKQSATDQEQEAVPATAEYKNVFQTSVFLGDSITEGLSFHDVLDEANVLAGAGKTAEFALEDIEELAKRNPKHIFILLGSDDILWPTDDPKQYSLTQYAKLIDTIKDKLPGAAITILPVTPVTAEAEQEEPRYRNIEDYNQGLKELAAKEQVGFVDLSSIFAGNPDVHDADGIHFKAEFYPLMLDLLKDQVK